MTTNMNAGQEKSIVNNIYHLYLVSTVDQSGVDKLLRRSGATIVKIAADDSGHLDY